MDLLRRGQQERQDRGATPQPSCPYPACEPALRQKVRLGREEAARRVPLVCGYALSTVHQRGPEAFSRAGLGPRGLRSQD